MSIDEYCLVDPNKKILEQVYMWLSEEPHAEEYTCRPVSPLKSCDDWIDDQYFRAQHHGLRTKILVHKDQIEIPLARVQAFDYNPRNKSTEIGFYISQQLRGRGYGTIALKQFVDLLFSDNEIVLNKVYATTSSHNIPSVALLERCGFKKEGELREHYWIGYKKYNQFVYSLLRSDVV